MRRSLFVGMASVVLVVSGAGCGLFGSGSSVSESCDGEVAVTLNADNSGNGRGGSVGVTDTTSKVKVVTGDWIAGSPSFSPDRTQIVVVRLEDTEEGGTSELAILNLENGKRRTLGSTSGNGGEGRGGTAWSPDGSTIAYTRTTGTYGALVAEVRLVDSRTGTANRSVFVTRGERVFVSSPTWSPDGRRIAFLRTDDPGGISPRTSIWMVNSDGANPREVASAENARQIDWHPDGSALLVSNTVLPSGGVSIVRLPQGTTAEVVDSNVLLAIWSGTGEHVYYFSPVGQKWRLAEGTIDDGRLKRLRYVPGVKNHFLYDYFGIAAAPCS